MSISLLSEVERRPVKDREMLREVLRERERGEGARGDGERGEGERREGERRKERREIATINFHSLIMIENLKTFIDKIR